MGHLRIVLATQKLANCHEDIAKPLERPCSFTNNTNMGQEPIDMLINVITYSTSPRYVSGFHASHGRSTIVMHSAEHSET